MLFPDQAGSGLVIIQTCGLESPVVKTTSSRCVSDLIIFQSTVSPDDRDQTDLISNVTGDRGEAMAGGLWGVAAAR